MEHSTRILILASALLALMGCRLISTPISRVLRHPGRYHGQVIAVEGRTSESVWFPEVGAIGFSLVEGADSLLVLTEGEAPDAGIRFRARGEFCRNLSISGTRTPALLLLRQTGGRVGRVDPR